MKDMYDYALEMYKESTTPMQRFILEVKMWTAVAFYFVVIPYGIYKIVT